MTALHGATRNGHTEAATMLADRGANIDLQTNVRTLINCRPIDCVWCCGGGVGRLSMTD